MFLTTPILTSASTEEYRYIQSADPADMENRFQGFLTALAAENLLRQQGNKFNIIDVDIAGGGDGHTFVVKFLLSTADTTEMWDDTQLLDVRSEFWLASDEQGLAAAQAQALADLKFGASTVTNIAVGFAGASKGTRYMAFIAGVIPPS